MLEDSNTRAGAISSVILILRAILVGSKTCHRADWLTTLFEKLMPCMCHANQTVRFNGGILFEECLDVCAGREDLQSIANTPFILGFRRYIQQQKDYVRFRVKVDGNYMLKAFHPIEDLTLEFVLDIFPRVLCKLHPDTSVTVPALERIAAMQPQVNGFQHIPFRFQRWDALEKAMRIAKKELDETESGKPKPATITNEAFQKKILPWQMMLESDLDLSEVPSGATYDVNAGNGVGNSAKTRQGAASPSNLIVIASLLSRAPNLGGLCRTCEIFGAELLVVADIQRTRADPQFQSLCVSADNWMPMKGVCH
jgi:hypothetical protein